MSKFLKLAPLSLCLFASPLLANDHDHDHDHDHETVRQHDAHVHGHVIFNIVQDDHDLLIEIESPGQDLVGFEHAPQTNEEKQHFVSVTQALHDPNYILTLPKSANCHVEQHEIHTSMDQGESHEDHEGHDHDAHEHHDHEEHGHEEHGSEHGSFTLEYQYHCENIDKLSTLSTQWFEHFSSTQEIQLNLLTDNVQEQFTLTADKANINW